MIVAQQLQSAGAVLPQHLRAAIHEYLPPMDGWTTPERGCEIAELVIEIKPLVMVEIGTFGGRSAIAQAFALRHNNNGGKLYCIDPWRTDYAIEGEIKENEEWYKNNIDIDEIHKKCVHAIWQHNLDPWLVVIRAASQYVAQLFPRISMLLIDGNHSEVASLRDAQLYLPRVINGGWVLFDDTDWEGRAGDKIVKSTEKAIRLIETQCDLMKKSGNMNFYRKR